MKKTRKINPVEGLEHSFIRSEEKALEVGTQCLRQTTGPTGPTGPKGTTGDLFRFPPMEKDAPFEISQKALQNTLKYIYGTLKHPCYMLCLSPLKRHFYKLEQTETAPVFEQMAKKEFQRIRADLTPADREHIETTLQHPFRIMQCIVKPQSKNSFSQEYLEWMGEFADTLPMGVFIFNLTDAVLLRKDGKMPFPMPTVPPTPILTPLLPIFSTSGQEGYWDIPIPTYDDIQQLDNQKASIVWNTDWDAKKEVAVFRGGPTGCGTRSDTNARLAVSRLKSPLLDAGVVSGESRSIRFDPQHGLSMLSMEGITPVERLTMEQQSGYKYIVHIDGNVLAYRLLTTMLSGSVILRIKSPFVSWIDHYLLPNQHYIEVAHPKDLLKKIQWCKENDDICQRIALRSREFAERVLTRRFITGYFTGLMWDVVSKKSAAAAAAVDCLPWERLPSRFHVSKPSSFRPALATTGVSKKKATKVIKAKKTTRKKSPSPPIVPIGPTESYKKTTEKEKCRKGFSTDRKNKMLCIATSKVPKPTKETQPVAEPEPMVEPTEEPEQEPVVEKQPVASASAVEQGSVEQASLQQGSLQQGSTVEPYLKANEKEKCRKGFLTDRKNKMRCVPKPK